MTKRVAYADTTSDMPWVKLNTFRKYHVAEPMPDIVPLTEFVDGMRFTIKPMNSLVMKYKAKNTPNLTMSERNTHASAVLKTDKTIPNMAFSSGR